MKERGGGPPHESVLDVAFQADLDRLVSIALHEDVGDGDWTTLWTVETDARVEATIVAKEELVVAGAFVAERVFHSLDPDIELETIVQDGGRAAAGDEVLRLQGAGRGILTAERTALNFLGRLSGIATLTRSFVNATSGGRAQITDTRKTTPGWRRLEKWAVALGGGVNHRMGLDDMALVKDNHIAAAGGLLVAVRRVRDGNAIGLPVEVEVASMEQLRMLKEERVPRILLDNMDDSEIRAAVVEVSTWPDPRPELEASGNMTLDRVACVAEAGVDWISVGCVTHSAPSADFSMQIQ